MQLGVFTRVPQQWEQHRGQGCPSLRALLALSQAVYGPFCHGDGIRSDDPLMLGWSFGHSLCKGEGRGSSELPGCPSPAHTATSAGSPPGSKGYTAFHPEWGGQPGQPRVAELPSAPLIPSARVVGNVCPLPGLALIGQSFGAVVVESCIVVEHLGNRTRPYLRCTHAMVTAEPTQRHDGRWHLFIFSFLLHWITSWKQGGQTL